VLARLQASKELKTMLPGERVSMWIASLSGKPPAKNVISPPSWNMNNWFGSLKRKNGRYL
jgi:glutamate synthase domain-containing protein 2